MTLLPDTRRQLMAAAERQASTRLPRPQISLGWLAPGLSLAIVLVLAAVFLSIHGNRTRPRPVTAAHRIEIVFKAESTATNRPVTPTVLDRTAELVRARLADLEPSSRASVATLPGHMIRVTVSTRLARSVAARLLAAPGRLEFYDWEADVLLPSGRTVASQLRAGPNPAAVTLSQGSSNAPPGSSSSSTGAMDLYAAVLLASRQPYAPRANNARVGTEYYLFSAPHSTACAATALGQTRCLLAGPLDVAPGIRRAQALRMLYRLAPAPERRHARALEVKQGTVVLEAVAPTFSSSRSFGAPNARFYVLRDRVFLFGNEITHSAARVDTSGNPDVQFGFNGLGSREFQRLTAATSRRGQQDSTLGQTLNQHIAAALDDQLITVPSIDYRTYPEGISGQFGADLTGGFTVRTAKQLARELRLGPLPVRLVVVG